MLEKLKQFFANANNLGLNFPMVRDPVTKQPSITLLFASITFSLAFVSVVCLHFKLELFVATATALTFWAVAVVFYMIRHLGKAKFDLDDKSFEIETDENENKRDNDKTKETHDKA
jgi:hypothetical protein